MKSLILGAGEIGQSLYKVLHNEHKTFMIDKERDGVIGVMEKFELLHICFPYSEKFIEQVEEYKKQFKPKYVVIHSTVPIGTSSKLNAIHSPCIGIHPHLEESMKVFTKFLGGPDASQVADYFRRAGVKVYLTDKAETTELMKIMSTSFYGVCIEFTKDLKNVCDKQGIPFEMWTIWTENYNQGYKKLGYPEYCRPNLNPVMKKIGGHCILPNLNLIKDSKFINFLKKYLS